LADRLRGEGEPSDGVEEGMISENYGLHEWDGFPSIWFCD
jgi:hypothetical protein